MVKLITEAGFDLLPPSPYTARLQALYATYGPTPFADFWSHGEQSGLCRVDGVFTLFAGQGFDAEEVRRFLDFAGGTVLCCEESIAAALGYTPEKSSIIVEFEGGGAEPFGEEPTDLKAVYNLLQKCGFDMGDYRAYLEDIGLRLRRNTAAVLATCENGRLLGTASALFIGRNSVLLGAVATEPETRGRGIASRLVGALAARYKAEGKRVFLFCRSDDLLPFYEKCNFRAVGRWSEIRLCDDTK